jgi:hypothetical protein
MQHVVGEYFSRRGVDVQRSILFDIYIDDLLEELNDDRRH